MTEMPILGRTYRYRYGYPWRWAIPAEVMWRVEHGPAFRGWGYRWRKHFEHKGASKLASGKVMDKLVQIARLLEVTPHIEAHGYDWPQIDRLLFDPEVQAAIHSDAP